MSIATPLAAHFDALFEADADPWKTRSRWYERRKRAVLLAMLPHERYRRAFEPGCGSGELTAALASRCDELFAADASAAAVAHARRRVGSVPGVRLAVRRVPEDWPDGHFDLVVVSELGYYLGGGALARLAAACRDTLMDDGTLVACHWRHGAADMLQTGQAVHAALGAACGDAACCHYEDADFSIDVWCRDTRSTARREGLA